MCSRPNSATLVLCLLVDVRNLLAKTLSDLLLDVSVLFCHRFTFGPEVIAIRACNTSGPMKCLQSQLTHDQVYEQLPPWKQCQSRIELQTMKTNNYNGSSSRPKKESCRNEFPSGSGGGRGRGGWRKISADYGTTGKAYQHEDRSRWQSPPRRRASPLRLRKNESPSRGARLCRPVAATARLIRRTPSVRGCRAPWIGRRAARMTWVRRTPNNSS